MVKKIIKVRDIDVSVVKKDIKNFHLSVLPPDGKVRVSVPEYVSDDTVKLFVIRKYGWIKKNIERFLSQERQTKREYVSGESHYVKGKRYILQIEYAKRPKIKIIGKKFIRFYVPPAYTKEKRQNYYEKWLRKELKKQLDVLVPKWEKITGIKANEVRIKKMKTKWGSCNPNAWRIWVNLELAKKPEEYLEYVILHELLHIVIRHHNKEFKNLLTEYMPKWKTYRRRLNEFVL